MVTHMKTTVELSDAILTAAKRAADADGITLRALLEEGLKLVLAKRKQRSRPYDLPDTSVDGHGLTADFRGQDWQVIAAEIYRTRGPGT